MPGTPNLHEGLIRTFDLLEHLRADVQSAYAFLEDERSSQFRRRCVVRAVFSYIEALVECVKVEVRSSVRWKPEDFALTAKEVETLGPLLVVGAKPGKFLPLDDNIKRTFALAAKVWELHAFRLATHGQAFTDFLASKSARNRLTHPRTYYDIEVTDHEMHCHSAAGMWIQAEFVRLFRARQESLLSDVSADDRAAILGILGKMSGTSANRASRN